MQSQNLKWVAVMLVSAREIGGEDPAGLTLGVSYVVINQHIWRKEMEQVPMTAQATEERWCSGCQCKHPVEAFGVNQAKKRGYQNLCREAKDWVCVIRPSFKPMDRGPSDSGQETHSLPLRSPQ